MSIATRLAKLDWGRIETDLWARGYSQTSPILSRRDCQSLVTLYKDESRFRKRVDMARHRFGVGEYKYFARPLPSIVKQLRETLYPPLATVANSWMDALNTDIRYAPTLSAFLHHCAKLGQVQPTPLLLRYEAEGYNCLHQDLYGEAVFPLQVAAFLNRPGEDYTGGEFLLVEQRPRAQSSGEAILPTQGTLVIFTTRMRPVAGTRGYYRVNVRHGVSRLRSGQRFTLGIIFHDAIT